MKLDKLADKRIFDFVVTVPAVVDKENERIPEEGLDESMDLWMMNGSPITMQHSNKIVGKGLRWWKDQYKGNLAYIARGLINDGPLGDLAWKKVKNKEFKDVSIGGVSLHPEKQADGTTDLNDSYVVEVALCEEGMHPDADILGFNEMAKSNTYKWFAKAQIFVKNTDIKKIYCPTCGKDSPYNSETCQECGTKIPNLTRRNGKWVHEAEKSGWYYPDWAKKGSADIYCPECGTKLDVDNDLNGMHCPNCDYTKKSCEASGPGTHSAKWNSCVEQVKRDNPNANAYAVCTAALGEESFNKDSLELDAYKKIIGGKTMPEEMKPGMPPANPLEQKPNQEDEIPAKLKEFVAKAILDMKESLIKEFRTPAVATQKQEGTNSPDNIEDKPHVGEASQAESDKGAGASLDKEAFKKEIIADIKKSFGVAVSTPRPGAEAASAEVDDAYTSLKKNKPIKFDDIREEMRADNIRELNKIFHR